MHIQSKLRVGVMGLAGIVGVAGCTGEEPVAPGGVNAELILDGTRLDIAPWALAVGADAAFVTSAESPNGRVVRIPLDGSPAVVIAAGLDSPMSIAVHGDEVFFGAAGQLWRLADDGSAPPVEVASSGESTPIGIAFDATHVYWTESSSAGAVRRAPLAGGATETIAEGDPNPAGLVVRGGRAYWTVQGTGEVRSANVDGTNLVTFAADQSSPSIGLAANDDSLFWFTDGDFPPKVMKAPLAGGAPVSLGSATTLELGYSSSVVVIGPHIYVRTPILEDGSCGVARLPIAGGAAEPVAFDPALGCPLYITGAGSDLYFTFPGGVTRLDLP